MKQLLQQLINGLIVDGRTSVVHYEFDKAANCLLVQYQLDTWLEAATAQIGHRELVTLAKKNGGVTDSDENNMVRVSPPLEGTEWISLSDWWSLQIKKDVLAQMALLWHLEAALELFVTADPITLCDRYESMNMAEKMVLLHRLRPKRGEAIDPRLPKALYSSIQYIDDELETMGEAHPIGVRVAAYWMRENITLLSYAHPKVTIV